LIHKIFDNLNAETILFTMRCVCKRFYDIVNAYNRYELDFRYISKSDLPLLARIIDPKNIISLTLSNETKRFKQHRLFLQHFHIDQFIRLRSLSLFDDEPSVDYQFQNVTNLELIIDKTWDFGSIQYLSTILNWSNLHTLTQGGKCRFQAPNYADGAEKVLRC
ncbi:unnamed protein product, partial [Rotaria sp. Silwood1]